MPQLTRIGLEPGNRMIRLGVGQHRGLWFARVDLWRVGYRLTRRA